MSQAAPVLRMPTLDSELHDLLHRITEEGGYAFASMAIRAGAGDGRAAEVARELAWEQLHSGPWHSVLPVWRDAYAIACLYVPLDLSGVSILGKEDYRQKADRKMIEVNLEVDAR